MIYSFVFPLQTAPFFKKKKQRVEYRQACKLLPSIETLIILHSPSTSSNKLLSKQDRLTGLTLAVVFCEKRRIITVKQCDGHFSKESKAKSESDNEAILQINLHLSHYLKGVSKRIEP